RWELDEDLREIEEDARKLLSTGSWRPVPAMPIGDHGGRDRGGTREAAQGERMTRGSSRKMRGSSCSAGSWWEIPATSAGNPASGDRCGTGSGGGGGAGTWRRRRRRRYVVTEAEHFLMGAKSRRLAAPAPSDARATAEEEDGGGGTCLRRFGYYEFFLQNHQ
uniref:Uncharacterized protein n=2 Tax=Aegilops tauschii subsp. strangulata TaxID=200361 RepID=A0A453LJC0_AEGTS